MAGDVVMARSRRAKEPPMHPAVEAQLAQAEATRELAAAVLRGAKALEKLEPLATGVEALANAQKAFCDFLVKHRLKLAASVPAVLIAVAGISPNAARLIGELLKPWLG